MADNRPESRPTPTWVLPAEIATPEKPFRRTPRDWMVDIGLVVLSLGFWAISTSLYYLDEAEHFPQLMMPFDLGLGLAATAVIPWRRRAPLIFLWAMLPLVYLSPSSTVSIAAMVLTSAIHRPWKPVLIAVSAHIVVGLSVPFLMDLPGEEHPGVSAFTVILFYLAFMFWGMLTRSHRRLVAQLRESSERDRVEHERRLDTVRINERQAIAREMHDVLAHRLSMLSVHAGGLAYRSKRASEGGKPLTETEVVDTVTVIGDNARQALSELAEILNVLRDTSEDSSGGVGPQLKLAELPGLVEDAKSSGQDVRFYMQLKSPESLRPQLQRTLFRTVQEGLTNARKHAPGSVVTVNLSEDSTTVVATVSNLMAPGVTESEIPGASKGLTGLTERVELDEGQLSYGVADSRYRLVVALPLTRD